MAVGPWTKVDPRRSPLKPKIARHPPHHGQFSDFVARFPYSSEGPCSGLVIAAGGFFALMSAMDFVSRLESRLGRFAIPGLVQLLAGLQLLTLVLIYLSNDEGREAFIRFLELDPERFLRGEVWRAFSHIFLLRAFSPLWALIGAMFLMWLGRGLDEAWGAFRVNLYVIGGLIALTAGALLFGYSGGGLWLFQTLLFAFAVFYPNEEIMLFFVIPIKVKWLAILGAATLAFAVLGSPALFWQALFANLNFLVAFGPAFLKHSAQRAKVMERRNRFESAQAPANSFFHQCRVCKKTELDDATLEFRVTDDGEEICQLCRAKQEN